MSINRENAEKSTGPITEAGKSASSKNSFRHGLTAAATIMVQGECIEDFIAMGNCFLAEHAPTTITEESLVYKMVQSVWLSKRAVNLQHRLCQSPTPNEQKLALYSRYQAMHDRAFHRAFSELRQMRADSRAEAARETAREAALAAPPAPQVGFVSQIQKDELHAAKMRQLALRSETQQVTLEHGKLRNARLLAAATSTFRQADPVPLAA